MHHRPWRDSNPGDLRPRSHQPPWPGQNAIDTEPGGPFAMFASHADGWAALGLWLLDAHDNRGLKTTTQKIAVFAPPSENDTASYAAGIVRKMGEEADPHDPAVRKALCQAIAHWEDWQAQWPEGEIDAGMTLCGLRWPAFTIAARQGGVIHATAPAVISAPPVPSEDDPDNSADSLNAAQLDRMGKEA